MTPVQAFRERMRGGAICVGPSITFSDPHVTEALCPHADFLWIDTEHTPMGLEAVAGHLLAARSRDTAALVRAPTSATGHLKRLLDTGAPGLIVPQIRSAAEAARVVSDCRYPPHGSRGFGPRVPMDYGRSSLDDYLRGAASAPFTAVQIENLEALAELDRIVEIQGLDSVVIGPMDLSGAMGRLGEVDHPDVVDAMQRIIDTARAAGVSVGIGMGADRELAERWAARGVSWIQLGCDFEYLVQRADALLAPLGG